VVVCKFWMKRENCGFLVKNELSDDFEVNWCFDLMFVMFFIRFKSM